LEKARAAGHPTASLLYHLAEATENEAYYEEAWKVSKATFPKAQRRLADLKRMRNLFAEAVPHYELALVVHFSEPCWDKKITLPNLYRRSTLRFRSRGSRLDFVTWRQKI